MKVRDKNAKEARNVRAWSYQGELCQPLQQILTDTHGAPLSPIQTE